MLIVMEFHHYFLTFSVNSLSDFFIFAFGILQLYYDMSKCPALNIASPYPLFCPSEIPIRCMLHLLIL